jgi:hypothetical protein
MRYVTIILMLFFLSVSVNSGANQDQSDILAEKFLSVTQQKEQNKKLLDLLKTQMSQQMNRFSKENEWNENQRKLLEKYSNKMTRRWKKSKKTT